MKKLALCIFLAILGIVYFVYSTGDILVSPQTLSISKGETPRILKSRLSIPISDLRYTLYLRLFQREARLVAGTFILKESHPLSEILRTRLQKPDTTDLSLTILPGWNIYDIDAALTTQ